MLTYCLLPSPIAGHGVRVNTLPTRRVLVIWPCVEVTVEGACPQYVVSNDLSVTRIDDPALPLPLRRLLGHLTGVADGERLEWPIAGLDCVDCVEHLLVILEHWLALVDFADVVSCPDLQNAVGMLNGCAHLFVNKFRKSKRRATRKRRPALLKIMRRGRRIRRERIAGLVVRDSCHYH